MQSTAQKEIDFTGRAAAGSALLFYDYILTLSEEVRFLWIPKRPGVGRVLFFLARYPTLVGAVIALFPATVTLGNILTCIRLITISFADLIFVARTWAVWQRDRRILIFFICLTIACLVPVLYISQKEIVRTVSGNYVTPNLPVISVSCGIIINSVKDAAVALYAIGIIYEFITLSLLLCKILAYVRDVPHENRPQLFHVLRRDGIIHFVLMFMFGVLNIALVLQVKDPSLRTAGPQLQTVTHSIISTRTVLHLYSFSSQNPPDAGSPHSPTGRKFSTMKFWHWNTDVAVPGTSANDEAAVESTSVVGEISGSDLRTPSVNVRSSGDNWTEDVEMSYTRGVTGGTRVDNDR